MSKKENKAVVKAENSAYNGNGNGRKDGARTKNGKKDKEKNKKDGLGGWLAAVIALGCSTVILAGALTYTVLFPSASDYALEAGYEQSFYDTVTYVDNLDLNLSKFLATGDESAEQKYLNVVAVNAELCENDLGRLPLPDESRYYTTKLVNQVGDYAKYLSNKLIDGERITSGEYESVRALYGGIVALKESLNEILLSKGGVNFMNTDSDEFVIKNFDELQELSAEYPELIYDGPFSDATKDKTPKGLTGEDVSDEEAGSTFVATFSSYGVRDVEKLGETDGEIPSYSFSANSDYGTIYAQISKAGGKVIMFTIAGNDGTGEGYSDEGATSEMIDYAEQFLESIEIFGMQAVWSANVNGYSVINFAFESDGVIVYPDMVKVKISLATGMVSGMDGVSYYFNHIERDIPTPSVSEETASESLSVNMEVKNVRKVIAPKGELGEELCYEFAGDVDGSTFYVYISAVTGRQIEMFKVVEGTEGVLLM
ncbi:MAG: germination protein YpeB [Clostridia bacterium]|nr:germination protein YpeB [Clostridia bacterium]